VQDIAAVMTHKVAECLYHTVQAVRQQHRVQALETTAGPAATVSLKLNISKVKLSNLWREKNE
jgi:hypothetical protein